MIASVGRLHSAQTIEFVDREPARRDHPSPCLGVAIVASTVLWLAIGALLTLAF